MTRPVRAAGELLGIDPLHVANEGKAVIGVRARERPTAVLAALRRHPLGAHAAVIGDVRRRAARRRRARHRASAGGCSREPEGELLPRIC